MRYGILGQRLKRTGGGLLLAVAATGWFSDSGAVADEIDEILQIERMAYDEAVELGEIGGSPVAQPQMQPATVASPTVRHRSADSLERELRAARSEIDRLQQELVKQEERHQLELQHSYYNMGCVYRAARQFERAEAEFVKALTIDPDDAAVHFNLGILYEDELNDKARARQHYQMFLELAPNDRDAPLVIEWLESMDS
ncbi:MAG: tetratricopeptide repeat protein [Verrucomicrobia bacterium]|nr:tetratricopeptide repeat protein [Verrucomicrobiota bacterium]